MLDEIVESRVSIYYSPEGAVVSPSREPEKRGELLYAEVATVKQVVDIGILSSSEVVEVIEYGEA